MPGKTAFWGKAKVSIMPKELKDIPKPQDEYLDTKPSKITTSVRAMFEKPKASIEKSVKPIIETVGMEPLGIKQVKKIEVVEEELEEKEEEKKEGYSDTLKKLEALISNEEKENIYTNDPPTAYVPENRRGFSNFIKITYNEFMLEAIHKQKEVEVGDKYPYQKFIREYMRQASPYRGILVYHGLGSGKTCTGIAASEALFSTSNKKIIIMTPKSLRQNFLKEITYCGFRHFRLKNYWIPLDKSDPIHLTFATEVLNISPKHLSKANHIWVPDFDQKESNFNELSPQEQEEIRNQIISILVYDEKTNPTGRIHFINYNGITAKKLKDIACNKPDYFDNAVIVIDEIHNLIRLMQGTIDPYLMNLEGKSKAKRKISLEVINAEKWKPSLCASNNNYKRAYLFYRLFLSARNSKIIALSGTPLINFPEELGILANVLHGYIPLIKGIVSIQGPGVDEKIRKILLDFPYTDFVEVGRDPAGGGILFTCSLLPEGVKKISNSEGVERIPSIQKILSVDDIIKELNNIFKMNKYIFTKPIEVSATPILPPFGETFKNNFLSANGDIKNETVIVKRLSGLISYYKGSRLDRMPTILSDEVIRVPMSEYQQRIYSQERSEEISKMKSSTGSTGLEGIWAEAYQIEDTKSGGGTNYRTASRQTGNFVFPPSITRPRGSLDLVNDEMIDSTPDEPSENPIELENFPSIPEDEEEDEEKVKQEEEDADDNYGYEEEEDADKEDTNQDTNQEEDTNQDEDSNQDDEDDEDTNQEQEKEVNEFDCSNKELFMENKADGNCLFESVAQVYIPIDIRSGSKLFQQVRLLGRILRENLADLYLRASTNKALRKKYQIPRKLTQVIVGKDDIRDLTLEEYASYVKQDKFYVYDTDLEVLSRVLNVPFRFIRQDPEGTLENVDRVRIIEPFGSNPSEDEYYTICNQDDIHFVLKKHEKPRENDVEEKFDETMMEGGKKTLKQVLEEQRAANSLKKIDECKSGKKGETYKEACQSAKKCLIDLPRESLLIGQGLMKYSPKFNRILENIYAAPGSSLVYSQFVDMEGIGIFRIVMDFNGYCPVEIEATGGSYRFSERTEKSFRELPKQHRYITFSGGEKDDIRQMALNVFNARFNELPEQMKNILLESGFQDNNNQQGQICRVFCITSAGAEGISLKNVRAVHIMDPHWNEVRLKQVKGRAIRLGSHADLDPSERNVQIFTYLSVFGNEAQVSTSGPMLIDETIRNSDSLERKDAVEATLPIPERSAIYTLTSDERLFVISERKKKVITKLETIMKSAAVDCQLNYKENKDGTYQCLLDIKDGKVGDFLYHPDLSQDILISASKDEKKKQQVQQETEEFTYKGKDYIAVKDEDIPDTYEVYNGDDKTLSRVVGIIKSKDGRFLGSTFKLF